jgi:hypothetical protein
MHPNGELIARFFSAFQRRDADGMISCYAPEIQFSDPVFSKLEGEEVGQMWRMLCSRPEAHLEVSFGNIEADEKTGQARWEARYIFLATGRKVTNRIHSAYEFKNRLIAKQTDSFSFYRWARMALGPTGLLLGWSPAVKNRVRHEARTSLRRFPRR